MEGSGRSELLDWHLLWLAFVVVNALLSSSDSPSLSSPSTRSLTFNFPSCMQMSVTFRFPVWNIIIVKKWIHWRTQVQHKNGMTTEKSGAGARCYHLLKKKKRTKQAQKCFFSQNVNIVIGCELSCVILMTKYGLMNTNIHPKLSTTNT